MAVSEESLIWSADATLPAGRQSLRLLVMTVVSFVASVVDGVLVESSFIYTYAGPDTSILGWGTYYDTVRIVDGVARISAKRIRVDVHADSRAGWATEADA